MNDARGASSLPGLESVPLIASLTKALAELDAPRISAADTTSGRAEAHAIARQALDACAELQKELRSAQQQFNDLTAALPQMLWVTLPDGNHIYFNQKWVEYTGRTLSESYGAGWVEAFHPDDRPRAWKRWHEATQTGEAYEIEYRLRRADGTYGWVLGRALPLRDETGRVVRWFGSCTDIDTQKRAEELAANQARELAEANRRLIEAERLKGEFFANVSHELRTPLTLILSPLESLLAEDFGGLSDAQRGLLGTMHNNSIRLLQMVTGLLDFSKLEARKFEVKREPLDIVALTGSILDDFRPMMKDAGIILEALTSSGKELWVEIDRYFFERIVFNLLSNAAKFTPRDGHVAVDLAYGDGGLCLKVTDTGLGIAESDIPYLFHKFQQLEGSSTRRFEGTGLGLAMVKEFARLLGGDVTVQSTLGQGTTFAVTCAAPPAIPLLPPEAQTTVARRIARQPVSELGIQERMPESPAEGLEKVLIVEDNAELAGYVRSLLRGICQTRIARDGEEGLQLAQSWSPDLVISDVMMPRKDGISLCRDLKADPRTAQISVALLTALTHRDALLKGWEAGADEYLYKPFHPRELVTRVKSLLSTIRERRRADDLLKTLNLKLRSQVEERTADLRVVNDRLRESEEQFRTAFELAAVGKIQVSAHNQAIVRVNAKLCDLSGYSAPELERMAYADLIHPDDQEQALRDFADLASRKAHETCSELRCVKKNGSYFWGRLNAAMIFDAAGAPMRTTAVIQDVSDHRALMQERERLLAQEKAAREAAEHLLRAKDEFLLTISHELRTPLTSIIGWTDLLVQGEVGDAERPMAYATIERNAQAELQLVNDLLDTTYVASRTLVIDPVHVDLNEIIDAALATIMPTAKLQGISVEYSGGSRSLPILGDRRRLRQLILNLLTNALKFTNKGGKISVHTDTTNNRAKISIADTGIGIDREFLPHVFELFRQADRLGKDGKGGLGIGLSLAQAIAAAHGGLITVDSEGLGKGTTFCVELPLSDNGSCH